MLSGTFLAAFASRAEDDILIAIAIAIGVGVGVGGAEKLRVGTTVDRLVRGSLRARLRNMVVA
ncbi:MAG: hypothetical protein WBI41_06195 [Azovibrio sp.]|uniref:hypothetical protein n=1 Tax=Azovibrio sp. TaxID=1872673 RepID=UPI003C727B62